LQQDLTIKEMGEWQDDSWEWKLRWRRSWFECEKASVKAFRLIVQQWGPRNQLEDQWEWKGEKGIKYNVSDAYYKILEVGIGDEEEVFQILW